MIPSPRHLFTLQAKFSHFPVVAMLGARQVGKTTLSKLLAKQWEGSFHHFDLEDPGDYVMCHGQGAPPALAKGITAVPAGNLSNAAWLPDLSFLRWGTSG